VLSGRPYIGLPIHSGLYYQFERAVMKLGMCEVNLDEYNTLVCESDQLLAVLPNITFTVMNSINITIPPKNYIYNIQNNLYKLAIIPLAGNEIILGTPFLSTVYVVLDYGQNNIGVVRNEDMQLAKSRLAFIVTFSIIGGITFLIIIILVIYCIKHKKGSTATPTNNGTNESFDIDTK
jgi:Eukaryotic aspartyl protease